MSAAEPPLVLQRQHGRVRCLCLNRPERRNALSLPLLTALDAALGEAEADPGTGAVVLTGAGPAAFCAGADLGADAAGLLAASAGRQALAQLLLRLRQLQTPLIGAAQGHALAGGLGLLLACDLVVVAEDARFGTPEIRRGLFPMLILTVLLHTLGRRRTLELALTGESIAGRTLVAWGGANQAVPAAEVLPLALQRAAVIAEHPALALGMGRQTVYALEAQSAPTALPQLEAALGTICADADAAEGIRAFFEKRPPQWRGR